MFFVKESRIAATPGVVFGFHEEPGAFRRLVPPWEKVEVLAHGGSLKPGSRMVLRTNVGPVRLLWVAVHTEYDPPHLFADRQERGPFAAWYHRHRFLDDGEGGTLLRDEVAFEPPLGWLGRVLIGRWVNKKLERTFEYRHRVTRNALEKVGADFRDLIDKKSE
jgi:ligand-binding SRPBCC domain-containing protein